MSRQISEQQLSGPVEVLGCDVRPGDYLVDRAAWVSQVGAPLPGLFGDRKVALDRSPESPVTDSLVVHGARRYVVRRDRKHVRALLPGERSGDEVVAVSRQLKSRGQQLVLGGGRETAEIRKGEGGRDRSPREQAGLAMQAAARYLSDGESDQLPGAVASLDKALAWPGQDEAVAMEAAQFFGWLQRYESAQSGMA